MNDDGYYEIGLGIDLADDVWFPDLAGYEDYPFSIGVAVGLRAGKYVATRIELVADETNTSGVSGDDLREIAVADLVEELARDTVAEGTIRNLGRAVIEAADGPTIEVLEVVATAYRYGYAVSDSPTQYVVRLLGISRSKASRWIARAREEGLLGETRERQAGGVVVESRPLDPVLSQRGRVQEARDWVAEVRRTHPASGESLSGRDLADAEAKLAEAEARLNEMEGEA